MIRFTLLFAVLLSAIFCAHAQSAKWITGGGTVTGSEATGFICADPSGNTYTLTPVANPGIRADSFYRAQLLNPGLQGATLITSYDCNGSMRWAKLIEPSGCYGLKYDNGGIYIAGIFNSLPGNGVRYIGNTRITGHDSQRLFLAKLDTMGNLAWIRFIGPNKLLPTTGASYGSLGIDPQGNIHHLNYISGYGVQLSPTVLSVQGNYDLVYDPSGNLLRAVQLQMTGSFQDQVGRRKNPGVAISASGKIFAMSYGNGPLRLCAFAPTGALLWDDTAAWPSGPHRSVVWDIVYDGKNGLYVSGNGTNGEFGFEGAPVKYNSVYPKFGNLSTIVKVDTNGKTKWVFAAEHDINTGQLEGTSLLPNGHIIAAGFTKGPVVHGTTTLPAPGGWNQAYYAIVDTSGKLVKMDYLEGNRNQAFTAMATDGLGNVYFGGTTTDTVKIPGGRFYKSSGGDDFFVTKLGFNCGCSTSVAAVFTNGMPTGKRVTYTYTGTTQTVDSLVWSFGDGQKLKVTTGLTTPVSHTHSGNAPFNVCVTAYSGCGNSTACRYAPLDIALVSVDRIKVYPNPTSDYLQIEGAQSLSANIINTLGQQVITKLTLGQNEAISLAHLPAGMYTLNLTASDGSQSTRRIIKF